MELNVNNYVRTKDGCIGKIIKTEYNEMINIWEEVIYIDNQSMYDYLIENQIIKSSPNIIDLIEVGDYVNGYEVTSIDQFLGFGNHDWYMTNDEITSIVTKEQFENISYKVGE